MNDGYVVKLLYENTAVKPRWVMTGCGRGLVAREKATVFPSHADADAEAQIWKALSKTAFSVIVETA